MRYSATLAFTVMLAACPAPGSPLMAQTALAADRAPSTPQTVQPLSIAIGLGAIAGVSIVNMVKLGVEAFPGMGGAAASAEMIVGANRILAVVPAVAGGWLGEYLYAYANPGDQSPTSINRVYAMVGGAIGGAAAMGLLTTPAATAPASIVAGSRILAATSAGLGAIGGAYVYQRISGETVDMARAATVVGGVLGGVVAWNMLIDGQLGTIPLYVGSAVNAGQELASASATAASRLYAVTSGSIGGLLAWAWTQPALTRRTP